MFLISFLNACNFSTANISDIKVCSSINDNQCTTDKAIFNTNTPEIFVSCHLNNPPQNTQVEFAWFYLGDKRIPIDSVVLSSGENIGKLNLNSSLSKPNNGWPTGDYEIVITLLETEKEPLTKQFEVQ